MPQKALDESHAAQILAGTQGRDLGHKFEDRLANQINLLGQTKFTPLGEQRHLTVGWPAVEVLAYIARDLGIGEIESAEAWWVGGLATGAGGTRVLGDTGLKVTRSKSDVVVRIVAGGEDRLLGVGIKTCNTKTPTNAQLYFTTARSFVALMRSRGVQVSSDAEVAMQMFCGDEGHRPIDIAADGRLADPSRWFWEELPAHSRAELEGMFAHRQDQVTRTLLAYAYQDDPLPPEYILHQRHRAHSEAETPMAIYTLDQFVQYSLDHCGFETRGYQVRKGRFKADPATHLAPRFGFVQMQRGGQAQHPTQLQFNLKAGYFNHAPVAPFP